MSAGAVKALLYLIDAPLTYDWNGHKDMEVQSIEQPDDLVAGRVRMLMRQDWNHEEICTLARDRIMGLSKRLAEVRAAVGAIPAEPYGAMWERQAKTIGELQNEIDRLKKGSSLNDRAAVLTENFDQDHQITSEEAAEFLSSIIPATKGGEDDLHKFIVAHAIERKGRLAAEKALRNIAEGNLGDAPWQANYDKIRATALAALSAALSPRVPGMVLIPRFPARHLLDREQCGSWQNVQGCASMTDIEKLVAEFRANLDQVTPGPWDVMTCNTVRAIDGDVAIPIFDARVPWKKHRHTSTAVKQEWHNARHVARCSPENIRALLDTLAANIKAIAEITKERDEALKTVKSVQASARLLEATRSEIYETYRKNSRINQAAVATLDSERQANAELTEELTAAESENERLRAGIADIELDINLASGILGYDLKPALAKIRSLIKRAA